MARNLYEVYTDNPAASIVDSDILYLIRSPYATPNDMGALASTFKTYFTDITGTLNLAQTTDATHGVITQNSEVIFHSYGNGNLFWGPGAGNFTLSLVTGVRNYAFGNAACQSLTTGFDNYGFGHAALGNNETGTQNIAFGGVSLGTMTSGHNNVAMGQFTLTLFEEGDANTAYGVSVLTNLLTGSGNLGLGYNAGSAYTSNESLNICLATDGVEGDNQVMRLGDPTDIFNTYIAGNFVYMESGSLSVGLNIFSGGFSSLLVGNNNESHSANYSAAIGNGNILAASQYGLAIGSGNSINGGTSSFIQGSTNAIGASAPSAILSGANNDITSGANYGTIIGSLGSGLNGNHNIVLSGNSISIAAGNNIIAGWKANVTNGSWSLVLGQGTITADESVVLTDQNDSYTITATQQFVARFVQGIDLNEAIIGLNGDITCGDLMAADAEVNSLIVNGAPIGTVNYLELNQNSTQAITTSTNTPVQFPNTVINTFGGELTISGTGNTTFTNSSGRNMYLNVAACAAVDDTSAVNSAVWLLIKVNRATPTASTIAQTTQDGQFNDVLSYSVSSSVFLANGDSFQIQIGCNQNQTLGNSSSVYGQVYRTSLIVSQIPGQ